jgi:Fic family protein
MKAKAKKDLAKALTALEASRAKLDAVSEELKSLIPLQAILEEISNVKTAIEEGPKAAFQTVMDENAEWYDSLSEKRQETEADEYEFEVSTLEEADTTLDEILSSLDFIKESIEPMLEKKE